MHIAHIVIALSYITSRNTWKTSPATDVVDLRLVTTDSSGSSAPRPLGFRFIYLLIFNLFFIFEVWTIKDEWISQQNPNTSLLVSVLFLKRTHISHVVGRWRHLSLVLYADDDLIHKFSFSIILNGKKHHCIHCFHLWYLIWINFFRIPLNCIPSPFIFANLADFCNTEIKA